MLVGGAPVLACAGAARAQIGMAGDDWIPRRTEGFDLRGHADPSSQRDPRTGRLCPLYLCVQ